MLFYQRTSLCVKYICFFPTDTLPQNLCEDICDTILKIHVLTGCNATSKVETKTHLKANFHLLASFG